MKIVIKNATIVTCDPGRTVLYDSAIAVENDRIAAIGPSDDLAAAWPEAEFVEGAGQAVFPGLVNCHTHLLATADRGILEDFGFPTRLRFPVAARSLLSVEERQIMAALGALEAIRSGTTCLLEISAGVGDYAGTLARTGLRLGLADSVSDADGEDGLARSAGLIEGWHGESDGRVACFVSPHAPETCSPALLRACRDMAEEYDVGYTIHLSQSHDEIEAVMRLRGVRPAQYLFANDFLGPRLVAAHCRYVDPSETALLGQAGVGVSNNAAIAARRGAAPPVKELLAAGCPVGMGSDNMAEDMVEVDAGGPVPGARPPQRPG